MPRPENASRDRAPSAPVIRAPGRLRAVILEAEGEELAVLEWPVETASQPEGFGPAEGEVLRLAAAGLSNAEIARARGRSARTIANQVARICRKLGVRSRLELFALLSSGRRAEKGEA